MQTNPSLDLNTLRDLENRVDTLRGQITLQEKDISANKRLLASQEYTIGQNDLKIKEQDSFIENRTTRQTSLTKEIADLESQQEVLVKSVDDSTKELKTLRETIVTETTILENHKVDLRNQSDKLDDRGKAVTIRELAVEEKEKLLAEKHKAVKELAAKL